MSDYSGDYDEDNISIIPIGERTTVPDDDVARLMYYLHCVDTVINYQGIDKLSDFKNYRRLTVEDMTVLFKLVLLFNPEIFLDAGIFILQIDPLPNGLDNQFYEITNERIGIHINNQIVLGGRTVRVMKVMVCNPAWLIRNYYRPWKNIYEIAKNYRPPPPFEPPNQLRKSLIDSIKNTRIKKQNGNTNTNVNTNTNPNGNKNTNTNGNTNKNTDIKIPEKVDRSKNCCCVII